MPPLLIGGAISAGGSILSGLLGANASSTAAQQQAAAGGKAASGQQAAGQQAQNDLSGAISTETANQQPFLSAGQGAVQNLSQLLAPGGALTQGYSNFSAPTAAQAAAQPGYQFQLQQGENALQNSAAARGGLLSTGTAKNLTNYAEGVASTDYSNVYNQALQAYNTNFNTFNTNNNNTYSRLMGLTGVGASAASNLNSTLNSGTQAMASNLTGNQQIVGSDLMGVGNAQAAGTIGQANAYGGALQSAAGALGGSISLASLLGAQNASNSGATSGAFNVGNPYAGVGQNTGFIGGMNTSAPVDNTLIQ